MCEESNFYKLSILLKLRVGIITARAHGYLFIRPTFSE